MRMQAKRSAGKATGSAKFAAMCESAAAEYKEMKDEELEELAEKRAMEMVDGKM